MGVALPTEGATMRVGARVRLVGCTLGMGGVVMGGAATESIRSIIQGVGVGVGGLMIVAPIVAQAQIVMMIRGGGIRG